MKLIINILLCLMSANICSAECHVPLEGEEFKQFIKQAPVAPEDALQKVKDFASKHNLKLLCGQRCYVINNKYFFPQYIPKVYLTEKGYWFDPFTKALEYRKSNNIIVKKWIFNYPYIKINI